MEQKKTALYLVLPALCILFGGISFMVWATRGKSARWVAHKMKIGGIILTLTTITTGCPPEIIVSCYDPIQPDRFVFNQDSYELEVDLPQDSVLTGTIHERQGTAFSFEVISADSVSVQKGQVEAVDGSFDQTSESFRMVLDSRIDTGSYQLLIQSDPDADTHYTVDSRSLHVK